MSEKEVKEGYVESRVVGVLTRRGVKFNGKVAEYRPGSLGIDGLGKLDFLEGLGYIIKRSAQKER